MSHGSHSLMLYATSRYGCWAHCSCGWRSGLWVTAFGAHLEFGRHLLERHDD